MIKLFDHVKIKETGITGIVVDIGEVKGEARYEVEADEKGTPGGYGDEGDWKLYGCRAAEIEKV
nr:MAG TPA: hypothetical protein [Caudoviricetes sp.]